MVTGRPSIASKMPDEVLALQRQQLGQLALALLVGVGQDQPLDQRRGARRGTCARCGTARCPAAPNRRARAASSAVSALARTAIRRAPSACLHHPVDRLDQIVGVGRLRVQLALEVAHHRRVDHRHLAEEHLAGRAVDRDDVALVVHRRRP